MPMDLSIFPLRALPDRGYVLGKTKPSGGKAAKERLTFMVTTNYTGSEKSKLLVIGKPAKPRGFPNGSVNELIVFISAFSCHLVAISRLLL